jgi:anti-sigma B factor antagonist
VSNEEAFVSSYVVDDDILVLKLHGKLDTKTVPLFNAEVEKQFAAGRYKMIIDCAHLGYVSSFGIGALVMLQARLRKMGGEVKLATIHSVVADVFKVVRLDKLFEMYGDIEFARESYYE